ncbi:hypothetical protein [Rhizobacter sp. SG703]|uniref:hypothetical protein n=1 Tax=Rhizobacter sp. SG703 TaxID=2587140 RepID=UPI0014472D31|nr:hypothetical protein [Rhizobacter sp. SG703]NKI94436.1 hypothetical protein [Rhizobacter sp. SG703]
MCVTFNAHHTDLSEVPSLFKVRRMSLPSPRKVLHSATKVLNGLNKAPEYFSNGQKVSARAWHEAQGLVYHKSNADQIAGAVANKTLQIANAVVLKVNKARDQARGALDDYVGIADEACRDVIRHAEGFHLHKYTSFAKKAGRDVGRQAKSALGAYVEFADKACRDVIRLDKYARFAKKAGRDLGRHAKRVTHGAARQVVDAGGVVAQGAEDAASSVRKTARNAGSRLAEGVRTLKKEIQPTRRREGGNPSDRRKSAVPAEEQTVFANLVKRDSGSSKRPFGLQLPEGFHYSEPTLTDAGVPGELKAVEDMCRIDGDTVVAYRNVYRLALYVQGNSISIGLHMVSGLESVLTERAELLWEYSQQGQSAHFCALLAAARSDLMDFQPDAVVRAGD